MDDREFWLTDAKVAPKEEATPPLVAKVEGSKKSEVMLKKAELSTKTESPETKHKVRRCAENRGGEEGTLREVQVLKYSS